MLIHITNIQLKIKIAYRETLVYVFLCLCIFQGISQGNQSDENAVQVIARAQENSMLLRWAVTTPSAWQKANKYGYTIQRHTVARNGVLVSPPEKITLTPTPILPKELMSWEHIADTDDYAAILAQALYGDSFIVDGLQNQDALTQIVNKAKESEQRFSFALFAADVSFEAAKMAALGYEDTTITMGEEYVYIIHTAIPDEILTVTPGNVVIKAQKPEPLPSPIDLIAVPDDKTIALTWDYEMFKSVFTSYDLERSENGKDFVSLNDQPLVNLNSQSKSGYKRMRYLDTLPQNNKTYYYRVKGITPFGETSTPSTIVSAQGIKKLTAQPQITACKLNDLGAVNIKWEFDPTIEKEILGFQLLWSDKQDGNYTIVKDQLASNTRQTSFSNLENSNYFKIAAIGKNKQKTVSLARFVQTVDETPPKAPVGLVGVIDTLGIVQLRWTPNLEKDVMGYRIYRRNREKEELSQVTISPITQNSYRDTIQIKSLNKTVYYRVVAVDKRYNMSEYSEILELVKPDIIPPNAPVFLAYKIKKDGIYLEWNNSTSDDVTFHQLYRQDLKLSDAPWELVFKTDTISSYLDKTVKSKQKYRYAIFAEDTQGLVSEPSTPLTLISPESMSDSKNLIRGFTVSADRENLKIKLSWKKMPEEVNEVLVYKSIKEQQPVLWKQLQGSIHSLEDTSVSPNNIYVYQVVAMTENGSHTSMKKKEIEF
ncbi:fibronectin type III domain-containing protein [Aquimarina pacifica]|uniref:fibronectin type III domain-containing protein n=1 Tax=Aquimarina pacifica TaxID=1296415 RepID=UPI000471E28A|nr:hypothetical protein [Aquimarina pacifica]